MSRPLMDQQHNDIKKIMALLFFNSILPLLLIITACNSLSPSSSNSFSRRSWLVNGLSVSSAAIVLFGETACAVIPSSSAAAAVDIKELPTELKLYTILAPLGAPVGTENKLLNLSLQDIANRLSNDLSSGATNKGGYFISGDLSPELFRDDCTFVDPTNSVSSLSRYRNALAILFDPNDSYVELLDIFVDESQPNVIKAKIRSGGVLKLPWRPRINDYESDIVYKIDEHGLIESQIQSWSISASEALIETFTPSFLFKSSSISKPL